MGMNLKDYYPSGEWDILDVPAERHARFYECCPNEFYAGNTTSSCVRKRSPALKIHLALKANPERSFDQVEGALRIPMCDYYVANKCVLCVL